MDAMEHQYGRKFFTHTDPPYLDSRTCQWMYFTTGKDGRCVSFLPSGKVVFPDRASEIVPDQPGEYLAASVVERPKAAFARLIRLHGTADFARPAAFGRTSDGSSEVSSHHRPGRIRLDFIVDPRIERFELLDYDRYHWETPKGKWEYLEYRHGEWRVVNYGLPHRMPDEQFDAAERRMWEFAHREIIDCYDRSPATLWSAALAAGVVTEEELNEASRRHASLWNYAGT